MMLLENKVRYTEGLKLAHYIIRFLARSQIKYAYNQTSNFQLIVTRNEIPLFWLIAQRLETNHELEPNMVNLAKDPILSFPWNPNRLKEAFDVISLKEWIQDDLNHRVEVWDPFAVIVKNGMHSISVGIWQKRGILRGSRSVSRYTIIPIFVNVMFDTSRLLYVPVGELDTDIKKELQKVLSLRQPQTLGAELFGIAYEIARRSYLGDIETIHQLKGIAAERMKRITKKYNLEKLIGPPK